MFVSVLGEADLTFVFRFMMSLSSNIQMIWMIAMVT